METHQVAELGVSCEVDSNMEYIVEVTALKKFVGQVAAMTIHNQKPVLLPLF
jgi:hypothetical protein